jgi:phage baseplate assembly protein V
MLRFGNITEVDPANGYARVTFTDDGIVSGLLQFLTLGAIKDKFSFTFNVNEQVACLMDENSEEGVILGAIFNDQSKPSEGIAEGIFKTLFDDGSVIEYNRNTSEYTLDIKGKINIVGEGEVIISSLAAVKINAVNAEITATTIAKITAPSIQLNGAVAVGGAITISGAISAPGGGPINGDFKVTGDIQAGLISLTTHKHTSSPGGGPTTTPIP